MSAYLHVSLTKRMEKSVLRVLVWERAEIDFIDTISAPKRANVYCNFGENESRGCGEPSTNFDNGSVRYCRKFEKSVKLEVQNYLPKHTHKCRWRTRRQHSSLFLFIFMVNAAAAAMATANTTWSQAIQRDLYECNCPTHTNDGMNEMKMPSHCDWTSGTDDCTACNLIHFKNSSYNSIKSILNWILLI